MIVRQILEAFLGPCQTSVMELFAKILNIIGYKSLFSQQAPSYVRSNQGKR